MRFMRTIGCTLALLSLLAAPPVAGAQSLSMVSITVNGKQVPLSDSVPYLDSESGRVMVPIRFVAEHMGAAVNWNESAQQATIVLNSRQITLTIGQKTAYVNWQPYQLETAPVLRNGRTYVPVRFVGEALGANLYWHENTKTVEIVQNNGSSTPDYSDPYTPGTPSGDQSDYGDDWDTFSHKWDEYSIQYPEDWPKPRVVPGYVKWELDDDDEDAYAYIRFSRTTPVSNPIDEDDAGPIELNDGTDAEYEKDEYSNRTVYMMRVDEGDYEATLYVSLPDDMDDDYDIKKMFRSFEVEEEDGDEDLVDYVNTKYFFSLQYPEDWEDGDNDVDTHSNGIEWDLSHADVEFYAYDEEDLDWDDLEDDYADADEEELRDGTDAYLWIDEDGSYVDYVFFFRKNDVVYKGEARVDEDYQDEYEDEILDMFKSVVAD